MDIPWVPYREDDDENADVGFADQPLALLARRGMAGIRSDQRVRIVEGRDAQFKADPMLAEVGGGFSVVPIEPHFGYIPQWVAIVQPRVGFLRGPNGLTVGAPTGCRPIDRSGAPWSRNRDEG